MVRDTRRVSAVLTSFVYLGVIAIWRHAQEDINEHTTSQHFLQESGSPFSLPIPLRLKGSRRTASGAHQPHLSCTLVILASTRPVKSLQRFFWWPSLRADVLACPGTCALCRRDKPSNKPPAGLLQPLPIPARSWERLNGFDCRIATHSSGVQCNRCVCQCVVQDGALGPNHYYSYCSRCCSALPRACGLSTWVVFCRMVLTQTRGCWSVRKELMKLMGTTRSLSTASIRKRMGRLTGLTESPRTCCGIL
jgi:hypothetical protein